MDNLKNISEKLSRIENMLCCTKSVLTIDEVASYSGLAKSYLYKLTSAGIIPHYKPNGKNIFFNKSEVDDWLLRNPAKLSSSIEQEAVNYSTLTKAR